MGVYSTGQEYKNILNGVELKDEQCLLIKYSEHVPKTLICLDTGLGKTYLSIAKMTLSKIMKNQGNWLVVVEKVGLEGWVKDIKKTSNLSVFAITGEAKEIERLEREHDESIDVLICTYDSLRNRNFINYLLQYGAFFHGMICDEGKNVASFSSLTHNIVRELGSYMKEILILNATPATVSPAEILAQLAILRYQEHYHKYVKKYVDGQGEIKNLDQLAEFSSPNVIGISRAEMGIQSDIKTIKVKVDSVKNKIDTINKVMNNFPNNRMLIYANADELKDEISQNTGIPIMDGRNESDRTRLKNYFNKNEGSVLITNVTRTLNLEAEIIVFAELTSDWYQFVGRSERGYEAGREKIVIWLIDDEEKYQRNIVGKSCLINIFTKKDLSAIGI